MFSRSILRSSKRALNQSLVNFKTASYRPFSSSKNFSTASNRFLLGSTIFGSLGLAYIGCKLIDPISAKPIKLDAPTAIIVQPETKVPFPTNVTLHDSEYQLLGVGVRSVSYFFQVYALGIYIAKDDLQRAKQVLISSASTDNEFELKKALLDPESGGEIISKLLAVGTRLSIRLVPVRNTDFGHLRDGFVRAVTDHPRFKQLSADNAGEGIGELKRAFGRKRSVPKGQILYLNRLSKGNLSIEFYQAKEEQVDKHELLGTVEEPMISELLFLKYLSGKNPSSESARNTSIEELAKVVTSS